MSDPERPPARRRAFRTCTRLEVATMAAITIIGFMLRLYYLRQPMRYDESFTYLYYASKPLRIGLTSYSTPNNHFLNTLLVHLCVRALGNHPWVIRLPVLLAGTATIPATFAASRRLFNPHAGLAAAALVAASSSLVEFSTNARGYAFVVLAFMVLVAIGTGLLERPTLRLWIAFAAVTAIGFYAVPVMLWPFGTVAMWMLIHMAMQRRMRDIFMLVVWAGAGFVLTLVAYLPVIATTGLTAMIRTARDLGAHAPLNELAGALWSFAHRDATLAAAVLVFGAVVGLARSRTTRFPVPILVVGGGLGALTLVLDRAHPPPRVWLFLIPLYFATSAQGLMLLWRRRSERSPRTVAGVALAGCCVLSALTIANGGVLRSNETGAVRDVPRIVANLQGLMRSDDRIQAFAYAWPIVAYYLDLNHMSASPADGRYRRSILVVPTLRTPAEEGVPAAELARASLVRRYPSATVYTVDRKP